MDLYLVDGSSYVYRAYHAIKTLSTSKGIPTNAVYGFTTMVMKLIREKKPHRLCIVFDSPVPTERHRVYEQYKAQRPEAPHDLVLQIPHIKEVVAALQVPAVEMAGYEADDIICTLARKAADQGIAVFIVTGDKDMMQVVTGMIRIYDPMKDQVIGEPQVRERFGIPPERIPELMALAGDAIDNIPGVKGIGEKTARDLLLKYDTLDDLLAHPERIERERLRKMITDNTDIIRLSRSLATIDTHLPVEIDIEGLVMREPDWPRLIELFTAFEFRSLIAQVPSEAGATRGVYETIATREALEAFLHGRSIASR